MRWRVCVCACAPGREGGGGAPNLDPDPLPPARCPASFFFPPSILSSHSTHTHQPPTTAQPPPRTLSDCLGELRDRFPENGTGPTEALRRALAAAGSQLGAALITVGAGDGGGDATPGSNLTAQALGAAPFSAFVTVSDKFDSLASDPASLGPPPPGLSPGAARERELFRAFHAGLPREKQAAWVLYNLIPEALTADQLGARKRVATHLADVVGGSEYDLAFSLPSNFALGGNLRVRDRLGQELKVLSSFRVCEGWVHTVDGLLWPGTTTDPASIPDPVRGGKGGTSRPAVPFAADRLSLPPSLAGADPNRIASTAFAATGAALDAAVATIQGSINSTGGGSARSSGALPPLPPPFRPGASARPSTARGDLDALPPSKARTVGAVVGGVVGGLVGVGVVGALAATLLLSARARRQTGGGGRGGRGGGDTGLSAAGSGGSGDDAAAALASFSPLDAAEKGGGGKGGKGGLTTPPGSPHAAPPPPPPPGTPSTRAKALLARALRGGTAGRSTAAHASGGDDTAGAGRELAVLGGGGSGADGAPNPPAKPLPSSSPTADAAAAAEWEMDPADIAFCVDPATGRRWRLGSGGFGDVYRARYQGSTDVAVKLVAGASPREQARFANEVAILKALRHTNVVQVREGRRKGDRERGGTGEKAPPNPLSKKKKKKKNVFFSPPPSTQFLGAALEPTSSTAPLPTHEDDDSSPPHQGPRIMLVTEYMPRGDLWRALAKDQGSSAGANGGPPGPPSTSAGPPSSTAAAAQATGRVFGWYRRGRGVALDVTRALAFMHSKKVLHCDVKSSNILLGRDGTCVVFIFFCGRGFFSSSLLPRARPAAHFSLSLLFSSPPQCQARGRRPGPLPDPGRDDHVPGRDV